MEDGIDVTESRGIFEKIEGNYSNKPVGLLRFFATPKIAHEIIWKF